jgi:flagellar protein FlbD
VRSEKAKAFKLSHFTLRASRFPTRWGRDMIAVKRLNDEEIFINPHLIEMIEATPDTVITLTTGKHLVVKDSTADMVDKIIQYRRLIGEKFTDYENRVQ